MPGSTLDLSEEELSSLPSGEMLEHIRTVRGLWIRTQRACVARAGADPDVFFEKSMPLSELFMCELMPLIHGVFFNAPQNATISVLDVGPQTFAGTRLLAALHGQNTFSNLKMVVSALDIHDGFVSLKECICPDVEFIKSDIFDVKGRAWDLVVCSHVIEHVPNPKAFVHRLQGLATKKVIIACPWNENPITTKGHQNTIDKAFVRSVGGENLKIYTNVMWGKTREVCMFTLDGRSSPGLLKRIGIGG